MGSGKEKNSAGPKPRKIPGRQCGTETSVTPPFLPFMCVIPE